MNVWFIYKTIKELTPFLYGYTNQEYLIEYFKEERKSSLFHIIKREMEKDEFKKFKNMHSNLELGRRGFYTSSPFSSGKVPVFLTATQEEEMTVAVNADSVVLELAKNICDMDIAFNDELKEALSNIYYYDIKSFAEATEYDLSDGEVRSHHLLKNASFDELSVFLYLYGDTLKK